MKTDTEALYNRVRILESRIAMDTEEMFVLAGILQGKLVEEMIEHHERVKWLEKLIARGEGN